MSSFNHTLEQITELKWHGFKSTLLQQIEDPAYAGMNFEDRLSHLISAELTDRSNRKIKSLLSRSRLKYKSAFIEDVDYSPARNIDKSVLLSLAQNDWINYHQNVIISGATGTGKTYLACALGNNAIAHGFSVHYVRVSKLFAEISLVRGDGSYLSWLKKLSKFKILILDDFGSCPIKPQDVHELLEIIEDRTQIGSIIITSQLEVKHWHDYLVEKTIADAILDRLIHNSHRIILNGDSMRKMKNIVF